MGNPDWDRPIEAVHEDGQVAAALLVDVDNPKVDDSPYYVAFDRVKLWARSDGSMMATSWRIRNVPERPTPTQYAPELVERMVAFVRRCDELSQSRSCFIGEAAPEDERWLQMQARFIVSDLPQEVDPDLILARECLMEVNGGSPYTEAGDDDGTPAVRAALAAIKKLKTVA